MRHRDKLLLFVALFILGSSVGLTFVAATHREEPVSCLTVEFADGTRWTRMLPAPVSGEQAVRAQFLRYGQEAELEGLTTRNETMRAHGRALVTASRESKTWTGSVCLCSGGWGYIYVCGCAPGCNGARGCAGILVPSIE